MERLLVAEIAEQEAVDGIYGIGEMRKLCGRGRGGMLWWGNRRDLIRICVVAQR